jgi:hypothetical protein
VLTPHDRSELVQGIQVPGRNDLFLVVTRIAVNLIDNRDSAENMSKTLMKNGYNLDENLCPNNHKFEPVSVAEIQKM